jgi:hypothetical protein
MTDVFLQLRVDPLGLWHAQTPVERAVMEEYERPMIETYDRLAGLTEGCA